MCGGVDRYFQIARCFRDEGGRADRQPEFTQLDLEMSFVGAEDIMSIVESTVAAMVDAAHVSLGELGAFANQDSRSSPIHLASGDSIRKGLPRMRFVDAMTRFGSDKPDVRYGLEIRDVTSILVPDGDVDDDVEVGHGDANLPAGFLRAIRAGRSVRAVRVPRLGGELSRKEIAQLVNVFLSLLGVTCQQNKLSLRRKPTQAK